MKDSKTIGQTVAFGVIIGAVIFALTREAFWIAIGNRHPGFPRIGCPEEEAGVTMSPDQSRCRYAKGWSWSNIGLSAGRSGSARGVG